MGFGKCSTWAKAGVGTIQCQSHHWAGAGARTLSLGGNKVKSCSWAVQQLG